MTKEANIHFDTVIVGLGKTGFSCAHFLANKKIGFAITDSRNNPPMLDVTRQSYPEVPLYLGRIDEELLLKTNNIIVSPGVSLQEVAIDQAIREGVKVYGDIELFCQHISSPVIAVTGSNGKSTVTTMVTDMIQDASLKVKKGGNIGTPVLDLLDDDEPDVYVLELSSFQLETTTFLNAFVAVVLNITEDHMDRYKSLSDYTEAKSKVYSGDGTMIINLDDPYTLEMACPDRKTIGFTLKEPQQQEYGTRIFEKKRWLVKGDEKLINIDELLIYGEHNIANVLAALALGDAYGLTSESMLETLKKFTGLTHRCQLVADIKGVRWYNDSKATNVGASCAAIKGLASGENIILIAGGHGKGADFKELAKIAKGRLHAVIVIGRDGQLIKKELQKFIPAYEAESMESAVLKAAEIATPGNLVLLSPACASLDMFVDFQARGDAFIESVMKMAEC